MTEELKPCPFCGGEDIEEISNWPLSWAKFCVDCGGEGPSAFTSKRAKTLWNSRAALKEDGNG